MSRFSHNVLCVFDAWDTAPEDIAEAFDACTDPAETDRLLQQSLMAGSEDWHHLVDCARSLRQKHQQIRGNTGNEDASNTLDGLDVLTYAWQILDGAASADDAWAETDRLIARAKSLEQDPEIWPPSSLRPPTSHDAAVAPTAVSRPRSRSRPKVLKRHSSISHYWSDLPEEPRRLNNEAHKWTTSLCTTASVSTWVPILSRKITNSTAVVGHEHDKAHSHQSQRGRDSTEGIVGQDDGLRECSCALPQTGHQHGPQLTTVSPYFAPSPATSQKKPAKKKPLRGTVSAIPFPPLTSPRFGLVQEELAHEPFWLLIAVTFLIRTTGKQAIPVLYRVKERFPGPGDIADPANTEELLGMIRHLGLSVVRVAIMQRYARGFLHDAPRAGVTYKVRNYSQRDCDQPHGALQETDAPNPAAMSSRSDNLDAWEIGHLTQGKYAIDSWRIFCRDELLGRAEDWDGEGREPEFQPEWMRVVPQDKELLAYLRWMWMREGWEWDPTTGERTVLRDDVRAAVNEQRVEYDDMGRIVIRP